MKKIIYLVILFIILSTITYTQVDTASLDAEKIINLVGTRLNKVFSSFSYPVNVLSTGEENNLDAVLDYTTFGFRISNKIVTMCYFWKEYDKYIRGVKIGDPKSSLVYKWGEPLKTTKSKKDEPILWWEINELDAYLIAWLDVNLTLMRVNIELK